jgi:hypothetical protein
VTIHGFNNTIEKAAAEGLNDDGIRELLIESMGNVTLASASEYTRVGGATVLFAEDGYVLQLDPTELLEFKKVISKCKKFIELEVVNNIYEIKRNYMHNDVSPSRVLGWGDYIESYVNDSFNEQDKHSAMSASTYFNGKVNFNGIDELILYMQFGGFSTEQLKNIINYDMIRGMHPSITLAALREYERVHGSNPALLQKSMAKNIPPSPRYDKGLVKKWEIGEKIQIDIFYGRYNAPRAVPVDGSAGANEEIVMQPTTAPARKLEEEVLALLFVLMKHPAWLYQE